MTKPEFAGMSKHAYSKDTHSVGFQDDAGKPFSITIRQAGGGNRLYSQRDAALFKPHERARSKGLLGPEISLPLGAKLFAETIVTDWDGINTADGKPFQCTPENVETFLLMFEPIFDDLYREANKVENFTGGNEPAIKNSQAPSDGGSSGANS